MPEIACEHVHDLLANFEAGHEHGFEAHELGGDAGPQNVRVQALEFGHDDADVLGARRRLRPASFSIAWQSVSVWMKEQMPQTRSISAMTWM